MQNPWLAIDVSTSPVARARELRFARERFLQQRAPVSGVRRPIADSWQRCIQSGIDHGFRIGAPELDEGEARERLSAHPLGRVATVISHSLGAMASPARAVTTAPPAGGGAETSG
jgi:hypothetical protein